MRQIITYLFLFLFQLQCFAEKKIVVIDPGHGGNDKGATVEFNQKTIRESDLTLSLAKKIKQLADKKYSNSLQIVLTRHQNNYLPLNERFPHYKMVDLQISLHYNSAASTQISGSEIYFPQIKLKDENSKHDSDVTEILNDVIETGRIQKSLTLAESLGRNWPLGLFKIRSAPFFILEKSPVPTLLLEVGYLTNQHNLDLLMKNETQNKIAEHILNSIMTY